MAKKLLIVDDDIEYGKAICTTLVQKLPGFSVSFAQSPQTCIAALTRESFEVIVLDIHFGSGDTEGLELIQKAKKHDPEAEVLMLSSDDDFGSIAATLKLGASDFISKVSSYDEIALRVNQAIARRKKRLSQGVPHVKGAVFKSKSMEEVFAIAQKAKTATTLNVLISGPTGAGKEVVAQAISRASEDIPFVAVNCGAITKSLIMSEFFGHEKGAFTGALSRGIGRFEAADGGDIFLDEVDSLDSEAQAALLRALETKEIRRVGSNEVKKLDFRVIAATNANIEEKVKSGQFREDLFSRLQGIRINVPPLAERTEDIPLLIEYIIKNTAKRKITVAEPCLQVLNRYTWPQNVRQLKQVIESMIALSEEDVLTFKDLPSAIKASLQISSPRFANAAEHILVDLQLGRNLEEVLSDVARKYVSATISALGRDCSHTDIGKALGMTRSTMQRRLSELGFSNVEKYGDIQFKVDLAK